MILNKYKYHNKLRYHFYDKKTKILSWKMKDKNIPKVFTYNDRLIKQSWRRSIFLNRKPLNLLLYYSGCHRYHRLIRLNKKKTKVKNWEYFRPFVLKKHPFISYDKNRTEFINNTLSYVQTGDSLYFVKNNIYSLFEQNTGMFKFLNVLNFNWLFELKYKIKNHDVVENYTRLVLNYIFKGFLLHGFKLKSEKRFLALLNVLKIFLKKKKKSGFQLLMFFSQKLKPVFGFRRKRLGRLSQKKQEVRYFFKLYHHNLRWQALLVKRFLFNSPYYMSKTKKVSVEDICMGLVGVLENKGPIVKGLISYYKLIGKRTPYAKRKKKKKKKRKKN